MRNIFTLFVIVFATVLVWVPSSAMATAPGDPTADLLPSIHCQTPTCQEAAGALSEHEYAQAGELFVSHYDSTADGDELEGAWLVHAAYAHRLAGDWQRAANLYSRAADEVEPLRDYLLMQAVYATLQEEPDHEIIARAMDTQALTVGYRDGFFLKARIQALHDKLPEVEPVKMALRYDDRDEVCPWLVDKLDTVDVDAAAESVELFDVAYGHCVDEKFEDTWARLSFEPSAKARLERADRLAVAVRFQDVLDELSSIDDSEELTDIQSCRADFRRARSHFRLRQRSAAEELYRRVIADCTDEANEDQRVRSLYAVGNRNYQRSRLDEAQRFFEMLYEQYPYRSHADDALFFLARIERQRDDHDREREVALLVEALEKYPHEDMIHEMAWEVYESLFRGGEYREFIDAITQLPLPDWDHEYFSQGRLEYFVGLSHHRLGERDDAARYWQLAWVKYPFSFYGYLSNLRLVENDRVPESLRERAVATDVYWFGDGFEGTGADILARAGHLEGACDFESARLATFEPTRNDRWRLATLCHQAGNHSMSHDIARRQIPGRPWAAPADGRLSRWHIAWPDPYGAELAAAITNFGPAEDHLSVHPGLASSIMREESGFHEDVVSWAGAIGLMQLMPATALDHDEIIDGSATPDRLKKAEINIPVGIDHIAHLSRRLDGHPVMIVAAYNAGAGRINGWLRRQPNDEIALWVEDIPFLQTRNYTKRVIGSYAAYQYLQGAEQLDARIVLPAR